MDRWLLQVILRAPLVFILNSMERVVTSLHEEFLCLKELSYWLPGSDLHLMASSSIVVLCVVCLGLEIFVLRRSSLDMCSTF